MVIMQAIIMAAGFGSRIEEITNNMPKSFLEINDKKNNRKGYKVVKRKRY